MDWNAKEIIFVFQWSIFLILVPGLMLSLETLTDMKKSFVIPINIPHVQCYPQRIWYRDILLLQFIISWTYRLFINYCAFSLKRCDFSELCQFCCSAGVLPAWRVYTIHTLTQRENRERPVFGIFQNFKKKQYSMNTLYYNIPLNLSSRLIHPGGRLPSPSNTKTSSSVEPNFDVWPNSEIKK